MFKAIQERPWQVLIDPDAIEQAAHVIQAQYVGVERRNREAWLRRFLAEVIQNPFEVLGAPPMQYESDPDMLIFPGNRHAAVSGVAWVLKSERKVYVFKIIVRETGEDGGG